MARFYYPNSVLLGTSLVLPDEIVRHIHVLRMQVGEYFVLFDGEGQEYHARLERLGKREAVCCIEGVEKQSRESPLNITLVQAISSGDRMDFTLQKSVELGVVAIQPIISERCVVRLAGERAEKKVARWQEIVISACEQCGRNIVPPVLPIISFREYLQQKLPEKLHLMMSLNQARTLKDITPPRELSLMIGPEGGWSPNEEQQALQAGVQAMTLGQRVLRTETASLAALAAMQTLWGDFC